MRHPIPIMAILALTAALSIPATAQKAQSSAPQPKAATAADVAEFDKQAAQVQENIKLMQEQMERIRNTQDPKARQKLLEEHWATMQRGMGLMQGMWGRGMMGPGMMYGSGMGGGHMMGPGMMGGAMMGWPGAGGYYSKLTPEQLKQRQYMMDQYMGMQQMMMNNMMQHQHYMWMQPPK